MAAGAKVKKVYVDGSGSGWICVAVLDGPVYISKEKANSHNESEWQALLKALMLLNDGDSALILTDSQLIARQFSGDYKTRSPAMRRLKYLCVDTAKSKNLKVRVKWIRREENVAGWLLEKLGK